MESYLFWLTKFVLIKPFCMTIKITKKKKKTISQNIIFRILLSRERNSKTNGKV